MAKSNINLRSGELSTLIGSDADLTGDLKIKNSARIDGKVTGKITSADTVTVGSGGIIDGDITANHIILGGKVTGNLSASGRTILEKSATLNGNLKTMILVVQEGAQFNGQSEMGSQGGVAQTGRLRRPGKITLTED